ncbi:MAG: SDR family NAD(P)-dependent oxidoreductase [Burkholderiaceae bacterium]
MAAEQGARAMMRMQDKRVIVVGAGSVGPGWGNGKAAAVLYAREGARVLCVDRVEAAAQETAALIRAEGHQAEVFAADMTREASGAAMRDAIRRHWGGVDVLHFNIGISSRGGVAETEPAEWARVFEVNLTAAYLCARAVLPDMKAQGKGALVFISSLAAARAGPYSYVSYEASKAALQRMSGSIAREYAAHGVRSNAILPGAIDTPHVMQFIGPGQDPVEVARQRAEASPMKRQGTAWDVANAALFLASDEAGFITGVDLRVDGGMGI